MKTIELKLYSFSELSEDAKQNAINNLQDINLLYDWYEHTYYDAQNIGYLYKIGLKPFIDKLISSNKVSINS